MDIEWKYSVNSPECPVCKKLINQDNLGDYFENISEGDIFKVECECGAEIDCYYEVQTSFYTKEKES